MEKIKNWIKKYVAWGDFVILYFMFFSGQYSFSHNASTTTIVLLSVYWTLRVVGILATALLDDDSSDVDEELNKPQQA